MAPLRSEYLGLTVKAASPRTKVFRLFSREIVSEVSRSRPFSVGANSPTQIAGRLTRSRGVESRPLMWAWLDDIDRSDTIGLIERDGTEKAAYRVWKELSTSGK